MVDSSDSVGPDEAFPTLRSLTNDPTWTDDDVTLSQSPSSQTTALTTRPQSATGGPTSAPEKGPESEEVDRMDPTADSSEVRTSMGGSLADLSGVKGCLSREKVRKREYKIRKPLGRPRTALGEVSRLPTHSHDEHEISSMKGKTHGSDLDGPVPSQTLRYPLGESRVLAPSGVSTIPVTTTVRSPPDANAASPAVAFSLRHDKVAAHRPETVGWEESRLCPQA